MQFYIFVILCKMTESQNSVFALDIKGLSAVSIIQFNHVLNAFRLQCLCRIRPWESAQGLGRLGHQGRPTQAELLRLRLWEVFPVSGRGHHWSQESRNPVPRRWNYVCVNSIKYYIKSRIYQIFICLLTLPLVFYLMIFWGLFFMIFKLA